MDTQDAPQSPAAGPPLPPLDETGIGRVLVVVAHPDDAEYGTSAAVASWVSRGIEVGYLLLTAGEAGMQRPPEEAGPLRAREQRAACEAVGVERLTILDFPDGVLEYGLELRRAIAREIRAFRPDAVVCGSGQLEVAWGFDHADHRAAGLAAIDAARDADNRWVFPELLHEEDLAPWSVQRLLLTGARPTHAVPVDEDAARRAIASLSAHEAYLADLPWHPSPEDLVTGLLADQGRRAGLPLAVAFAEHWLRE
jgi:LmbE family N-acetylglucosaminyl deacetylase